MIAMSKQIYPIAATANFFIVVFSIAMSGIAHLYDTAIFDRGASQLSRNYDISDITPARWAFKIWFFVCCWQILWVLYSVMKVFKRVPCEEDETDSSRFTAVSVWIINSVVKISRRFPGKQEEYEYPRFIPVSVLVLNSCASLLGVIWLISFGHDLLELSLVVLVFYVILLVASLFLAYRALDSASPLLAQQGRTNEIWLTRGLVHNGLAIQGTCAAVAMLLNLAIVLANRVMNGTDASTVSLSILTVAFMVFVVSDLFYLDRYSRYTITPYIAAVIALGGILSRNCSYCDIMRRNTLFTVILFSLSALFLFLKIAGTIFRHSKGNKFRTEQPIAIIAVSNASDEKKVPL